MNHDDFKRLAVDVATLHHDGQVRWYTNEPYVAHVVRVHSAVVRSPEYREWSTFAQLRAECAALLHDILEDTDYPELDLYWAFGAEVADTVCRLTHRDGDDYFDDYLPRIKADPVARVIKRADMCDNMCTLPFTSTKLWDKYTRGIAFLSS